MANFNVNSFAGLQTAITTANTNGTADTINITGNITLTGLLPLIQEDVGLTIEGNNNTLNGDGNYRHFFIRSGTVSFNHLTFANGKAQGTSAAGGGGAGMGGSLFLYSGTVDINNSAFEDNQAIGGNGTGTGSAGGRANFTATPGSAGAFSGDGTTNGGAGGFGGGGGIGANFSGGAGGAGGFGGGGGNAGFGTSTPPTTGGVGGAGGYGGGGGGGGSGAVGTTSTGGSGGFGAGNGGIGATGLGSNPGGGGGGAGMGGAIFIRSGSLTLNAVAFNNNSATGGIGGAVPPAGTSGVAGTAGTNGQGLGGAIFAMQSTTNSNSNNQGMPTNLPTVDLTNVTFTGNTAADDTNSSNPDFNNDDLFGDGNNITNNVDNTPPTLTSITRNAPTAETTNADSLVFQATFSEAVENVDATDFTVSGTTATITNITGSGTTYEFTVSGGDLANLDGTVGINLSGGQNITDLAGNALPATAPATNQTYTSDNSTPTLTSITRNAPTAETTNADSLVFQATFSEAVENVDATDFTVSGTTATITNITGSGTTYEFTVSGGDLANLDGTVGINLSGGQNITDLAGNALPATAPATNQTYTSDNSTPTVTSITPNPTSITDSNVGTGNFTLTVDFSEAMDTGVNPTINLLGEDASNTLTFASGTWSDSDTYVATYNVTDANTALANIDVDVTGAQDVAGNGQTLFQASDAFSINTNPANPTPGNPTPDNPTSDNPTSGNSTSGNSTSDNPTSGNSTSGNSTSGNSTSGNSTSNPETDSGETSNPLPNVRLVFDQLDISLPAFPTTGTCGGDDVDDLLLGNETAEAYCGLGGNDTLAGFGEADRLDGNAGNDIIFGNTQNDTINGGTGDDLIFAGKDDDLVVGGEGLDEIMGDIGNDTMDGNAGNDILFGNTGADILDGDDGDDMLFGGEDNDILLGGAGNDILNGDFGDDLLIGGAGGDRFDFRAGDGIDVVADFTDGVDIIGLKDGLTFADLTLTQVAEDTQVTATGLSITLQNVNVGALDAADFAVV